MPELRLAKIKVGLAALCSAGVVALLCLPSKREPNHDFKSPVNEVSSSTRGIFTPDFSGAPTTAARVHFLRQSGKLKPQNEQRINDSIYSVARHLHVPTALLWCQLFQQSDFDHLTGLNSKQAGVGLGKFSPSNFYEINFQTNRYSPANLTLLLDTIGHDVRPVQPNTKDIFSDSSYFSIPTAVAVSAAYLNNRYLELNQSLLQRGIAANSEILWLYAALAYEGGSRAVLAWWNEILVEQGLPAVQTAVSDPNHFREVFTDAGLFERALSQVWGKTEAWRLSQRLLSYQARLNDCALTPTYVDGRQIAQEGSLAQ